MKKTVLYFFAGLIVLTSANSCKENAYTAEAAALDSLFVALEISEQALMLVDTTETTKAYNAIVSNLKLIQTNLKDTVTREEALVLSDYRGIRKRLGKFSEQQSKLLSETVVTKKQLSDLSKDLRKGLVPKDKVKEYYMTEYSAAAKLNEEMELTATAISNSLNQYNKLRPGVEQFISKMDEGK